MTTEEVSSNEVKRSVVLIFLKVRFPLLCRGTLLPWCFEEVYDLIVR